jgi:tetratricopeptide (TPR) repeat protein
MRIPRHLLYSALTSSLAIASVVMPARAQTQTPKTTGEPSQGQPSVPYQHPWVGENCEIEIKNWFAAEPGGSRVNYELGWCYLSSRKFDDAIASFQKSIQLIPEWIKQRAEKDTSHLPKLSKEKEEEFKRNASPSLARFSLGYAYHQAGRYDEAIAEYQQIKFAYPEAEEAGYQTALVHLARGDRKAAVQQVAKLGNYFERRLDYESKLLIPDLIPSDESISNGSPIIPMTASERPTILYREKAKYTEEARQAKMQGTVVLQVIFRSDGVIVITRAIRNLPYGLTAKSVEAASRIRFTPAMKDGAPVSVKGALEFTFNLY